ARLDSPGRLHRGMIRGIKGWVIGVAHWTNVVSLTEFRNGSRRGKMPMIGASFGCKLVEDFAVAITEIALQLGISTSEFLK
ncbi:MAG: hypothetical protein ACXWW4_11000, partial [Candidatus Binatia bacterium]